MKKESQRKIPLARQIYENCLDAFVSGVSLGQSSEVDAPQVNIQYAVLEIDEEHHELVEKLYFDQLTDFVYVELIRGLQRGFVPQAVRQLRQVVFADAGRQLQLLRPARAQQRGG